MKIRLETLLKPEVSGLGYELVNLQWQWEEEGWVLRLFINTPKAKAVTLRDCETVSRHVDQVLDKSNVIEQAYTLEVSSPGLDRSKIDL